MLIIVIPASINAYVAHKYPIPEAFATVIESRDGYHNKWDLPKEPTIQKFKERYPQFSQYEHPEGKPFGWLWYYAMQHMGDEEAAKDAAAMKDKLRERDKTSRTLGYLFPSIHTQFSLNSLSRSDMSNYLNFIHQLELFYEEKRLYFYPKIFENVPVSTEDWEDFTLQYTQDTRTVNWLFSLLPLLILSLLMLLGARRPKQISI